MIDKERIEKQDNKVLAVNPFGAIVAATVVGYNVNDIPLVKFKCSFNPVAVDYCNIYPVPTEDEIDEDLEEDNNEIEFSDTVSEDIEEAE